MRDTPERDLAVAENRLEMADDRIRELEKRIRTLESACEAALKWFSNEPGFPRDSQIVKQLEGAIKHG